MKKELTVVLIVIFFINFMMIGCDKNPTLVYGEDNWDNKIEDDSYFKDINNLSNQVNSEIFDFENRIKAFNKSNEDFFNIWSRYIKF